MWNSVQYFALGISFSGLLCSSFEYLTGRPANFGLMFARGLAIFLFLPILFFSAPYILIRNSYRALRFTQFHAAPFLLVALGAVVWGIVCGRMVLAAWVGHMAFG